jgi:hypothetical protein
VAEELRFFLRTALYVSVVAAAYWFVSREPTGTVLLVVLGIAIAVLLALVAGLVPRTVGDLRPDRGGIVRRALGRLNRLIGFHDPRDETPPLEGGPDLIPLSSPWPIVTAAGIVIVGLGLIFGAWLTVPGFLLLGAGGVGWLTQLDRA